MSKKIIETNDKRYLAPALSFWKEYPGKQSESIILQKVHGYDTDLKRICLEVLSNQATNRSIPFLLSCLGVKEHEDDVLRALVKFKMSTIIVLIRDDNNKAVCDKLIPILAYRKSQKYASVLMEQLRRDVPAIKKASILALGRLNTRQAVPALLELFKQADIIYLDELIRALADFKEASIVPRLPEMFMQYPALRITILKALMRMGAKKEIMELYEAMIGTGFDRADTTDKLQYNFAAYFAVKGEADIAVELIFHHLTSWYDNYAKETRIPGALQIQPATLFMDLLMANTSPKDDTSYEFERKTKKVREGFLKNDILDEPTRNSIFHVADIPEASRLIVDTIYLYDIPLAKELTLEVFSNKNKEIADIINDKLNRTGDVHQQMLLIGLIGAFKTHYGFIVQPFLRHHEDELTAITIQVLGHLNFEPALDKFITHLRSANKELAQIALNAINNLCASEGKKVDQLLLLIYDIEYLQILLTLPMYANVLKQLRFEELMSLAEHENARFRYLATLYLSILGHGKAFSRLNMLLEDSSPVDNVVSWYNHKTVGEGALFALDTIGTPSAKTLADNWRQRKADI